MKMRNKLLIICLLISTYACAYRTTACAVYTTSESNWISLSDPIVVDNHKIVVYKKKKKKGGEYFTRKKAQIYNCKSLKTETTADCVIESTTAYDQDGIKCNVEVDFFNDGTTLLFIYYRNFYICYNIIEDER